MRFRAHGEYERAILSEFKYFKHVTGHIFVKFNI
jgi:hypothetical protein